MSEQILKGNVVTQVAIVVRDGKKYTKAWAELLGVEEPEFRTTAPYEETNAVYRGKPMKEARAKLAFFQLGDQVSLEIIEPVGGPSIWQEWLDEHGDGIHHIAFGVEDMDGAITSLGEMEMGLAQRGDFTGGGYAYIDSAEKLGVMLELLAHD
jgi:hypothetical protein